MTTTNFSKLPKDYLILINRWAKRLEATDVTLHRDNSVSLYCNDDCICEHYKPSMKELIK